MQSLNQAHLICMELVHLIRWTTIDDEIMETVKKTLVSMEV